MSWLENRIPEPLLEQAKNGTYLRVNPYPVSHIVGPLVRSEHRFVTKDTKIVALGSCFAQELAKWLKVNGYCCLPHKWGVVYNPASIMQIARYSFGIWQPRDLFWMHKGVCCDPYRKADGSSAPMPCGGNYRLANDALHAHYQESAELLSEADLVVMTLGLTETWRNRHDQSTYYAVPFPEVYRRSQHEFYNLKYEDVLRCMEDAISFIRRDNRGVRFLLSVSPVPLSISFRELGPYVATQYSKSVLHAAAIHLVEKYENVFYMPSYEIARSDPLAYYKSDGRHVNSLCVDTIMEAFQTLYVKGA